VQISPRGDGYPIFVPFDDPDKAFFFFLLASSSPACLQLLHTFVSQIGSTILHVSPEKMPSDTYLDPSSLEEGRAHHDGHPRHHHNSSHHATKRMRQLAQARKRKREAARLHSKLPGVMRSSTADVGQLRKRLSIKNEIIAALAEFCGTFLFLFFAFGIATQAGQEQLSQSASGEQQTAGTLDTSQLLYSSLGFG